MTCYKMRYNHCHASYCVLDLSQSVNFTVFYSSLWSVKMYSLIEIIVRRQIPPWGELPLNHYSVCIWDLKSSWISPPSPRCFFFLVIYVIKLEKSHPIQYALFHLFVVVHLWKKKCFAAFWPLAVPLKCISSWSGRSVRVIESFSCWKPWRRP